MYVSLGGWWLGRCGLMCRYVCGGWVDTWMDVSIGGWWLDGCKVGCVGIWVAVVWIYGWMCR